MARTFDGVHERVDLLVEQVDGVEDLEAGGGVPNVARGEAEVEPTTLGPDELGDGLEERRHLVAMDDEYLFEALVVVGGGAQLLHVGEGNGALLGPRLADG